MRDESSRRRSCSGVALIGGGVGGDGVGGVGGSRAGVGGVGGVGGGGGGAGMTVPHDDVEEGRHSSGTSGVAGRHLPHTSSVAGACWQRSRRGPASYPVSTAPEQIA